MTAPPALVPASLALASAALMLWHDRARHGGAIEMFALLAVIPLAAVVTAGPVLPPVWAALVVALVAASLARGRGDPLASECALKLLWVLGTALALSWAGNALLGASTGTLVRVEQWSVLAVGTEAGIEPGFVWTTALPLSLLAGVVMLGGAPFHFWPADLVQGSPAWIGPLAVAALETCGAAWLAHRLAGIEAFTPAARLAGMLLTGAAVAALAIGAATLVQQRRPERRVGSLASLNGALVLASLAAAHGRLGAAAPWPAWVWGAHLSLALTGATILARFVPVSERRPAPAPVLFRRHPAWGAAGLYAWFSLAGVPGTPGAGLWLDTARSLAAAHRTPLLLLLGAAWVAAFATAVRQAREAFGTTSKAPAPRPVPREARWAMAIAAAGLVLMLARRA